MEIRSRLRSQTVEIGEAPMDATESNNNTEQQIQGKYTINFKDATRLRMQQPNIRTKDWSLWTQQIDM